MVEAVSQPEGLGLREGQPLGEPTSKALMLHEELAVAKVV